MKKVVVKRIRKSKGKVFTKKRGKGIINKNYNPLKVNCKIHKRRDGLYMKSKKKKFISLLFKICSDLRIKNSQEEIKNFLNRNERND